jgi:hypothetical protein
MGTAEKKVINKIESRAKIGLEKYGTTTDRTDLSLKDWATHLQEELLDGAIYAQKVIDNIDNLDKLKKELAKLCKEYKEKETLGMMYIESVSKQYEIFELTMKICLSS